MPVRDASEEDVAAIATILDAPSRAVTSMLRDRTVRISADAEGDIVGVIGFDATVDAVQISTLAGDRDRYPELLAEPIRFGTSINRCIEMVVPNDERETIDALRGEGFDLVGVGPSFRGAPTTLLRFDQ